MAEGRAKSGERTGRSTAVRAPVGDLPVVAVFLHRDFGNHAAVRFVVIPFRKPTRLPQPAFPHEKLQLASTVRTQETAWNRRIPPFIPKGAECARLEPVVRESGGEFGEGLPSLELGMEPLPRLAVLSQVAKDGNGLPFLERAPPVDDRPAVKAECERQKAENRQNQKREKEPPTRRSGMGGRRTAEKFVVEVAHGSESTRSAGAGQLRHARRGRPRRAGGIGRVAGSCGRLNSTVDKTCAIVRSGSGDFNQNHARWNRRFSDLRSAARVGRQRPAGQRRQKKTTRMLQRRKANNPPPRTMPSKRATSRRTGWSAGAEFSAASV